MVSSRISFSWAGLAAGMVAMSLTGCSKDSPQDSRQPGGTEQQQNGPAWTLTLKSACAQGQEQCLAQHGFSIDADGKYQVGPGPQGQTRRGTLTDPEFNALKARTEVVASSVSADGAENRQSGVENESDDTLTLARPGRPERMVVRNQGAELSFTTASADEARSLHATIRALADSYYRLPFGDACGDAADRITAEAAKLQACETDADCAYIDAYSAFAVVPPASVQWLLTEDCTAVRPPTVANKLAILGGAEKLNALYGEAQATCGAEFYQSYFARPCSYDYKETSTQPVCIQNVCKARF